ncbi:MAG TPA: outer membrane protein assembly factor BamA [Candidatus Paceibacterota bacterium]|nr:outer membrane protein assembly factor BamA [Verrucomicrobiota bacterium]HRY49887.1 outer membrane protein assembly factor BamA [Candidatus Paceibacterota bacterium]HSA00142.1 outer membrane protein assembly factor BamA [Candidatus Paceibacterota bacterium]
MKLNYRRYAILLALLLWGAGYSLPAQIASLTPPSIRKIEIKHVGPPAASDDLIRANIRIKPGDPYTRTSIDDDVRTLYNTGNFYNIRVGEEPVAPDGVNLTFVVQGKPVLSQIQFTGNKKFSRSKLQKKLTSKVGEPLDERKLFTDTQEIKDRYQKAGHQKTQVKYSLNIDENAGRGTVIFEIEESPRVKIDEVIFEGAQAFTQKKLRKVIKTRDRWMFSWLTGSGVLKDEQFEDDKDKLATFYRNEGYVDFEIQDVKFEQKDAKWMVIHIHVREGRQYHVGSVTFQGNSLFNAEEIRQWIVNNRQWIDDTKRNKKENRRGLRLTDGRIFTPTGLTKDLEAIQDFYGSRGYIDARIQAVKSPNVEKGAIDLVYKIEEKEKSYIEKIEIKGNEKTKDRVIRRELAVAPGELFDMVKVKLSERRLENLNYFEKVDAQPEPTDPPIENRKNLVVGVEEKNTGHFTVGAGFSSMDNLVGYVELSQGNFDLFNPPYFSGGGQKLRLRVQIGTERQDYILSFIEPWLFGRKLALGVDLFHREYNYLSDYFDETHTGGKVGLTRALGTENLIGNISYTIENVGIVDVEDDAPQQIMDEKGHYLVSKVGASIAYDTRNKPLLADRGQRTELQGEVAPGALGSEVDFYKLELRSAWYFRGFADGHILEVIGRVGVTDSFGDSDYTPIFERYFLGGQSNLRGFDYREAGADDTFDADTEEPLGGHSYWYGSLEYSVPIIDRLRFALFYDIGNVYWDPYDFNMGDYRDNVGAGIRLNLPIGPLRFDYGIPISTGEYDDSSGQFHFGVGFDRNF